MSLSLNLRFDRHFLSLIRTRVQNENERELKSENSFFEFSKNERESENL